MYGAGRLVRCRTCPHCAGTDQRTGTCTATLVCLRPQPGILDRLGPCYYQWFTGLRFAEIEQAVPITEVRLLYTPYHEMDVRQFADKMNELYRAAKPETNLKALRSLAGLSQSELAEQADVPVRTIQQYEQRQKDINKAQAETLLRLARTLNCNVEDLMEKVPPSISA